MALGIGMLDAGVSAASTVSQPIPSYNGGPMSDAQMDKVSKDFESLFIGEMLEPMFGDSEGESAFGSSESGDIYKGLLTQEYGKEIARSGGIGIADFVKKELLKLQETSNPARRKATQDQLE